MILFTLVFILSSIHLACSLNNGLGLTPQMGWGSIYPYGCRPNETLIQYTADVLVATQLAAAGYEYVIIDDCWQNRRVDDVIQADQQAFPSGMQALGDYIHAKKLKYGLSSDAGYRTCNNRPGSLHYEKQDAEAFASWGVDYLKYENCFDDGTTPEVRFPPMRDALNATGRPIFLAIRQWGATDPAAWEVTIANSFRTTQGGSAPWSRVLYNIDINNDYAARAGPGGWNDPDDLQIGNGVLNGSEERAQFSLWAISKAPLIIGADLSQIGEASLEILKNAEVIAVNQDALGVQGKKVAFQVSQVPNAMSDVVIDTFSFPTTDSRIKRFQWVYDEQDGSLRSLVNNLCVTIEECSNASRANIIVSECRIADPQAQCQGKNQQWTYVPANQTFVSQLDGQCLDAAYNTGPNVDSFPCTEGGNNQVWVWNSTVKTLQSKYTGEYLAVQAQLEVWAGPLTNGSQAVVLFNRGRNGSEPITVQWSDIGFPAGQSALVRDLWAHEDLGSFTDKYTSPNIDFHSVMMLKITPTK